eukprot:931698-Amphidinium_carterae.1
MSGVRAPIARALSWCGWRVEPFDVARSPDHDLRQPELQQQLLARAPHQAAVFVAMDCATFSRARER